MGKIARQSSPDNCENTRKKINKSIVYLENPILGIFYWLQQR